MPDDAAYVLEKTKDCQGFYGASSMERLPSETALVAQTRRAGRLVPTGEQPDPLPDGGESVFADGAAPLPDAGYADAGPAPGDAGGPSDEGRVDAGPSDAARRLRAAWPSSR